MSKELGMTIKKQDFSKWYSEVLQKGDVIDNRYPLQGSIVWKPYGFKSLKLTLNILEEMLEETGHMETYFPTLIPNSVFSKERDFLEGFGGESFKITKAGKNELEEELILRPTSETIMYEMFKIWIRSWRDLPLKIFQTINTFRYETKMTKPLLRGREIIKFNESHTIHKTAEEAEKQIKQGIEIYKKFFDSLSLSYLVLKTPEWDTFAGAEYNYDFFMIMPDKNIIELGSVINLGQKFSKSFQITFEDENGEKKYPYQTCYGVSERTLAGVISMFGDDSGLVMPPSIAPHQVVIIPIKPDDSLNEKVNEIKDNLEERGIRVNIDDSENTIGYKFNHWELKGVPIRIEIGQKELAENKFSLFRRDKNEKKSYDIEQVVDITEETLDDICMELKKMSEKFTKDNIHEVNTIAEAKEIFENQRGIIKLSWCGSAECGNEMEEKLEISALGEKEESEDECVICGKKTKKKIYLGKTPY